EMNVCTILLGISIAQSPCAISMRNLHGRSPMSYRRARARRGRDSRRGREWPGRCWMAGRLGRAMTENLGPASAAGEALTTIVHPVRHGEVANPEGILYGRLPGFLLSDDGEMMAKNAASFLAGRDVTLVRSSPLERAVQTAEPIAAQFSLPIEADERLI